MILACRQRRRALSLQASHGSVRTVLMQEPKKHRRPAPHHGSRRDLREQPVLKHRVP
jgi:hypothetical protein